MSPDFVFCIFVLSISFIIFTLGVGLLFSLAKEVFDWRFKIENERLKRERNS